ncbi:MAG: ArnT family glycosyltransferase [Vicinamibacterales bacterium]
MQRLVLLLLVLACLTFGAGLGAPEIADADEAFYAEAAREMVERGDWLTPHYNYEFRWQKPVLYYWLTAATFLVTGVSEWGARFWSSAAGVGLVLLTFAAGRVAGGTGGRATAGRTAAAGTAGTVHGVAFLGAAIAATCFGYVNLGRSALPDLPLAFCTTLTIWAVFRAASPEGMASPRSLAWWALAGLGAGLGFLVKGPLALVVPALVLVPVWWRERPAMADLARGAAVAGAVFAVVGLPWYVAMTLEHGAAYVESFFIGDNLERFATDRFNAPRPVWFYLPVLAGGLMPWSAFLVALPWRRLAIRWRHALDPGTWRLWCWAMAPLLFFTVSIGKQPRYVLPILPPLAILLAHAIAARMEEAQGLEGRPASRRLAVAVWLVAALSAALAVVLVRLPDAASAGRIVAIVLLAVAAGGLIRLAIRQAWRELPVTVALASAALVLAAQLGLLTGARPSAVEEMATLVEAHRTGGEAVGQYQVFVRNLVFYTGRRHEDLFDEQRAIDFVRRPERVLLVVRARDRAVLERASGVPLHPLASVGYFNRAALRVGAILQPDLSRDVETVLLVTNVPAGSAPERSFPD